MAKIAVYCAGPYTLGDVGANMNRHLDMYNVLLDCGYYPLMPCLNHFLHMYKPRDYEVWLDLDFVLLERANCMIRLEGESPGSDREEAYAKELGIPVYHSLGELRAKEPVKREPKYKNYGFVFGGN